MVLSGLDLAEKLGASYAEVRYHGLQSFTIASRNGSIIASGSRFSEGVAIRVLVEGAMGFSSTNALTMESVEKAVKEAYSKARTVSRLMREPLRLAEARLGRVKYSGALLRGFDSTSIDEKIELHEDLWKHTMSSVKKAKLPNMSLDYTETVEEKFIATSDGARVSSRIPRLTVIANIVLLKPGRGTIHRWMNLGGSGGLELLDSWQLYERLPSEVENLERVLVKGVKPPIGEVDVVLGSELVGLIVHESCGHPCEADRILGREAAQAGMSFVKPDALDKRIGGEYATVIDDPTVPGGYGFYLYDDEGVPARPKYLYLRGYVNELLHNRWTAAIFHTESNGSARSAGRYAEPIVRMSNTYLRPGDMSFQELLEDIRLGVYIKSFREWNIDDVRWSQRYVGLEAYAIRNGELAEPVRNPVLEITTGAFYERLDGADKSLEFWSAFCGKGEPAQPIPVWTGGPNARLRGVRLGVVQG